MRAPVVAFIALLGSVFPLLCAGLTIPGHRKAHSSASSALSSNPAASSSAVSSEDPNSLRSTDRQPVAVRAPETTLPYLQQPTPLYFNTLSTSEATALNKKGLLRTFTDQHGHVTTVSNHIAFPPGAETSLIAALHTLFTDTPHKGTMDHNTRAKTSSASVPRPTITAPPNALNRRWETVVNLFPDDGPITVTDPAITPVCCYPSTNTDTLFIGGPSFKSQGITPGECVVLNGSPLGEIYGHCTFPFSTLNTQSTDLPPGNLLSSSSSITTTLQDPPGYGYGYGYGYGQHQERGAEATPELATSTTNPPTTTITSFTSTCLVTITQSDGVVKGDVCSTWPSDRDLTELIRDLPTDTFGRDYSATVTTQSTSGFPVPEPHKYRDLPKHYTLSTKKTATVQPPSISNLFPLPNDTSLSPRDPPPCWEEQYLDGNKVWMWNCAEEPHGQECWVEKNRDGERCGFGSVMASLLTSIRTRAASRKGAPSRNTAHIPRLDQPLLEP
ncbi:hypothetical protein V8F06_009610 [Rhypophila decipiens]